MDNKKIKVLHLIDHMNDGGAQRIVLNYLNDLSNDEDIEIKVLVYNNKTNSYCNRIISQNKYNVDYLFFNDHNKYIRKIKKLFLGKKKLRDYIKNYNPDIVHVHISAFLKVSLKEIIKCNIPLRFDTLHSNPYRYKGIYLKYIRKAFQSENFIGLCVTNEQALCAKSYYGLKRYEVVKSGIDIEKIKKQIISKQSARKQFNILDDAFVIIGVGRLNKIKRFDFLIDIFAKIYEKNENAILLIAGDGKERKDLQRKVKNLNLEHQIYFLGNLDNIIPLYCLADVLAITSVSESASLTLLESQICGLRSVISNGVPDESIFTTKVKKMAESSDIDSWAKALLDKEYVGKKVCQMKDYEVHENSQKLKQIYLKYWKEFQNGKK